MSKLDNGQVQGSSSDQHRANWLWFVLVGVVWCCGVGGCEAGGLECRLCVEVVMQRVDYVVQRDGARVLSVKVKERAATTGSCGECGVWLLARLEDPFIGCTTRQQGVESGWADGGLAEMV